MTLALLLFWFIFFSPAQAEPVLAPLIITEIPSDSQVILEPKANSPFSVSLGDLFAIQSQDTGRTLGYARAIEVKIQERKVVALIRSHSNSSLIRMKDSAFKLKLEEADVAREVLKEARIDLVISGDKRVSSKFKPQVYLGPLVGQTAATLERDEWFIGPSLLAYGITENWQIASSPLLYALNEPNFQGKYQLFENDDYRVSASMEVRRNLDSKLNIASGSFYWDTYSNSKFLTYHQLRFTSEGSTLTDQQFTTDFSVNYGYITNRWNRIIFGPNLNFQRKTLGGLASFQWVWDQFTSSLSIYSTDFTNFRYNHDGYLLYLDFWWRI